MSENLPDTTGDIRPAIVTVGYDRPGALSRLLNSLKEADYDGFDNITLVISIDKGGDPAVTRAAEAFDWGHGEKRIIKREERMGLKKHILS